MTPTPLVTRFDLISRCRKYRWTSSSSTTIESARLTRLVTLSWAATPRGRSYATGATCWPTRADRSPSGTRYRKCPRRTNRAGSPVVCCMHTRSNQVPANWVGSDRARAGRLPVGKRVFLVTFPHSRKADASRLISC